MSASIHFVLAALKKPFQVSTLFQTTGFTVSKLLKPLKQDPHCSLLELGSGAGAVTSKANKLMANPEKYLGVEINPDLFEYVKKRYPNFKFICGSAEAISEFTSGKKYDLVVSTLPWSLLDDYTRKTILEEVSKHLEKGAYFKTYMVCNALLTKKGKKFRQQLESKFEVSSEWELLNIPPALVYECRLKTN